MAATIDLTDDEVAAVVDAVDEERERLRSVVESGATADPETLLDPEEDRTPADSDVAESVAAYRRLEKLRDHATDDGALPVYDAWSSYVAEALERAAADREDDRAAALADLADRYRAAGDLPE